MKRLAALLIILLGCATLAIRAHATTSLGLSLHVTDSADSIFVRLTWSPVRDARGDTVAYYVATIRDGTASLGATQTQDTTYVVSVEKVPGATHSFVGEVYAFDVRGNQGARAVTDPFIVEVADPGPPAPEIRLDTIPVQAARIDSLRIFFPAGSFDEQGRVVMVVGDTLQGCVVGWTDGIMFRPDDQPSICLDNTFPAMLYRPMLNGVRVRQTE